MKSKATAVILAAGTGNRMNSATTKQRMTLGGISVLRRAVLAFEECSFVDSIVVVSRAEEISFAEEELSDITKLSAVISGGKFRAESAKMGFEYAEAYSEYIAIHDGARCFVTPSMISEVIHKAIEYGAATASAYVTDTVKVEDGNGFIASTADRNILRTVQTPQAFKTTLYREALDKTELNESITDDNMLLEGINAPVYLCDTGKANFKITSPEDFVYAEYLIACKNKK